MPKACKEFVPIGIVVQHWQSTVSLSSGFSPYEIRQQRPFSLVLVTSPKISPDCSRLLTPLLGEYAAMQTNLWTSDYNDKAYSSGAPSLLGKTFGPTRYYAEY
jgi:hypothetical protein